MSSLEHAQPQRPSHSAGHPAQPVLPGAREFYGGLAVLIVLAGVVMMRGGSPRPSVAAPPRVEIIAADLERTRAGESSEADARQSRAAVLGERGAPRDQ